MSFAEVPTRAAFDAATVSLQEQIDQLKALIEAQAMPDEVKAAMKIVLEYFLKKVTEVNPT